MNVLIGKNNAGKSNVLAAIEIVIRHLAKGTIAARWETRGRAADEFTDRDINRQLQIGVEFELDPGLNAALRQKLKSEAPQYENVIDQIISQKSVSVIVTGLISDNKPFIYIEQISVGDVNNSGNTLSGNGFVVLDVRASAARDLFRYDDDYRKARSFITTIDDLLTGKRDQIQFLFREKDSYKSIRFILDSDSRFIDRELITEIDRVYARSTNWNEFHNALLEIKQKNDEVIEGINRRQTTEPLRSFTGDVHVPPKYALWLASALAELKILYFREIKEPIGAHEASELLQLKVRRGGSEKLNLFKQTVKTLLGVDVDAYEPDDADPRYSRGPRRGPRAAEMDVNDFLVEVNGAGIREALRIVIDMDLKEPNMVLIEEPEIHLHPGLENALHRYLLEKSRKIQIFLTTHSTNFVDWTRDQNVYLISRAKWRGTEVESIARGDQPLKISGELGLRLSSVFMYDRLVFVEGQSDEAILREFAAVSQQDLTAANVGFVHMGGVTNFAHYAVEGTLDLLSTRNIKMWFIVDRDERSDSDVESMFARLGARARLWVLERRELENYLLDAGALRTFLEEKGRSSTSFGPTPAVADVRTAIHDEACSLKAEVLRLRMSRKLLRPIYPVSAEDTADIAARISAAITSLQKRAEQILQLQQEIGDEIERDWDQRAMDIAPGSIILDRVAERFGLRFAKESDGARLARLIARDSVPGEIRRLLSEITE